jgi:hypothetical protein
MPPPTRLAHPPVVARVIGASSCFAGRTRPLCAYPTDARYAGTGNLEDGASVTCAPQCSPGQTLQL